MLGNKAFLTIALIGVIATVIVVALIMIPITTTKFYIQRYLQVEYNYNNAEMVMLELLSYPDIRHDIGLYAAGLGSKANAAGGAFDKAALAAKVSAVLDKLIPDGGCYAIYYDAQPYSSDATGWTIIAKRGNDATGAACNTADLGSVGRAFLPLPQGNPQVMLILKTT